MLFTRHHWSLYLMATKLHILELLHEIRPPPTSNLFIYLLFIIQFTHLIYSHESLKTYFFTSNIKWYFVQNSTFNSLQYFDSPFAPDNALMGDDDGGDSSLTKTIDPNLVNVKTTSTEEIHVQPQGGTNRKFCQKVEMNPCYRNCWGNYKKEVIV